ncbi:endonuclease domain-containing protein [Frankia sp. CcWB2]
MHLLVPPAVGAVAHTPGLVVHRGWCDADERRLLSGIPVTTVERTLADLVLDSDRETAVSLLDAALRGGHLDDVHRVRAAAARRWGTAERRGWFDLVDRRAESPLETRLRLLLTDAGLAPEQLQWPVWEPDVPGQLSPGGSGSAPTTSSAGRGRSAGLVARLDMAWPSCLLAVEADGAAFHEDPHALFRDRVRQNALLALGWRLLRFTWADALSRRRYVVEMVEQMLLRQRQQ